MLRDGQVEEAELADAGVGVDAPGAVADGGDVGGDLGRGDVAVGFEEGEDGGGEGGGGDGGLVVGGGFVGGGGGGRGGRGGHCRRWDERGRKGYGGRGEVVCYVIIEHLQLLVPGHIGVCVRPRH